MTKNDDQQQQQKQPDKNTIDDTPKLSVSKSTKSVKSVKSARSINSEKRLAQQKSRRVKFAEPIIHLRLYDRTASPNAETEPVKNPRINPTALDELSPPLSLVAHLDLAAKKLNARGGHQQTLAQKILREMSPSPPPLASTMTAHGSKTQFPNRDQQVDANKTETNHDILGKNVVVKPHPKNGKLEPKNDPKKDNKKTKN